ncbi:unnamed protein product [Adineta steineri]|uniref:Uncharacterized protein n=1 Tax=Adineta steineri TaxID=433720 RepID=A0A814YUI3_9BILA|nr:unnamed protein product [Adineta steineri]CAF1243409.1 unnamed protein product [Adineta steineri]
MISSDYQDALRGRYQQLPDVRSKVVRIFLSSTFSDTMVERDSLIENVFPKLKSYCREKYGLEFQYADMRWGIPTESNNNHSETETCLKEIELCQKYSVATNFVVLLGHRYGSRPTPATIRASLFEQLYSIICSDINDKDDAQLLSQWYQLDTNRIPAVYILRPISSILPNILSPDTNEVKQAEKEWKKINTRIRTRLRQAATKCLEQQQIQENEYDDFFISVTEKEIINGILSVPNANERTLCFLREFEDIHEHLSDNKASKYIDLQYLDDGTPIVDDEVEKLLNRLKYTRIPNVLQSENIYKYKIHWTSKGINRDDHIHHIERFNNDFYNAIQQQIDQCVQSRVMPVSDPLHHEVLEHAIQCKTYVAKFHGRTDILNSLKEYINNDNENRPCIVYGTSGCGKTSLLAKAATEISNWWPNRSISIILRFLGTTSSSSTMSKSLLSISEQICRLYNISMENHSNASQLRYQLEKDIFPKIPPNEYIVVLFDSIDQLSADAYDCKWLPINYPKNIKCIISTLSDHGNILSNLKMIINNNNNNSNLFLFVSPFDATTVEIVYNDWLKIKQRSLSDEQRLFIRDLVHNRSEILPLFMKLLFDIILTWHSYDPIDNNLKKLETIDDCILYLFSRLKTIHNSLLVSRSLCYMTASRNGISQNELEDVLSLDDDVIKNVFQHYIPPVKRLPGLLWTRIRNDLDEYITEKEVDDLSVIYWYHRRFIEIAEKEFISNLTKIERTNIFQNMVDLYTEKWSGKAKPFKIDSKSLINKYNLHESNGEIQANRLISSQPIQFIDGNGQIQFNKRKLNELPNFLSKLAPDSTIPIAAKEIFFSYSFMRNGAKIICSSFDDITEDLRIIQELSTYGLAKEITEIKNEIDIHSMVYMLTGSLLEKYPENYSFEITSRLLRLFGVKSYITHLIKQLDEFSINYCSLIVPYCQIEPPGGGLLHTIHRHTSSITSFKFTEDLSTNISLSDKIVVIDLEHNKTVLDINLPKLNQSYLNCITLTNPDFITENDKFKNLLFFINSSNNIYLISANEDIKFNKSSQIGYVGVEVFDTNHILCIIAEINGNYIECWDIFKNELFQRIEFPSSSSSTIKYVFCINVYSMIITVFHNGNIYFHSIMDDSIQSNFIHRGSIELSNHLDLVTLDKEILICTFDSSIPIDFAFINLNQFKRKQEFLNNNQILKILIKFDYPLELKPIKKIILPYKNEILKRWLHIIHLCRMETISYTSIKGQFDTAAMHVNNLNLIYTARGGIIEVYIWKCLYRRHENDVLHKCQLYVSIDVSSSPITTIFPAPSYGIRVLFFCSLQNGTIHLYNGKHTRDTMKTIAPFPRTNESIQTIQLLNATAITLDISKRELTSWSYQHSTSIKSSHIFENDIIINGFAMTCSSINSERIFVLVITSDSYAEIYLAKSLGKNPLFHLELHSSARVHSTKNGNFIILTKNGTIHRIVEQIISNEESKFNEIENSQLNIQCSMMFSSILTINSKEYLIVFDDNGQSMAVCSIEQIIYIDINFSLDLVPLSSHLLSIIGDSSQDLVALHFDNKSLTICQVKLAESSNNKGYLNMISFDKVDKFCLKNDYFAKFNNVDNELSWYNINLSKYHEFIKMSNECLQLCMNESSSYIFVLIKSCILFMYRIIDNQQLAKLYLYDIASFMIADNDFIVLSMNDRRLLTLMIADPQDSTVHAKIHALPSRTSEHTTESATTNLIKNLNKRLNPDSSDDYSDSFDDDDDDDNNTSSLTRFPSRYSPSKMNSTDEFISKILSILWNASDDIDVTQLIDDSDDENSTNDDRQMTDTISIEKSEHEADCSRPTTEDDLNDIRQKVVEYDRQQLKGVQFANAGHTNLKVVNSYPITSHTCSLF